MNKEIKKVFIIIIILLFLSWITITSYLYFWGFDIENYFWNLNLNIYHKVLIVFLLYFFRNYLLLPSTLVILFAWFFLQDFVITLIVSIIWVSIWIFQTYFVWYIFWDNLKKNKNFKLISKYNIRIKQNWFKVIFLWSLFPVIPVDILYYSAWIVKYNILKSYIAWILWEMPLIILYVYLWKEATNYSQYLVYIAILALIIFLIYIYSKKIIKAKYD